MPEEFEKLLIKYPVFLGKIVLGEEIYNYEKFGFPTQKSLEESISAFCIGEKEIVYSSNSEEFWRTGNLKNCISLNMHGDLYASQTNVFGKKEILEIKNWKNFLESLGGGRGTATSEAMFGTSFSEWELERFMETPVLNNKLEKLERFPLSIHSGLDSVSYPYISENKLFYLKENESGNISLEKFSHIYKDKNFSRVLEYSEEDLIPLLSAIYKYFARDRRKMGKILDYFNSKNN